MAERLHIVASCTDRKRIHAGEPVRMRDVDAQTMAKRASAWWRQLEACSKRVPARELYVGAHWSIARDLPACANERGFDAKLWVTSAGYGLVGANQPLASYSATFAVRQQDTVVPDVTGRAAREAHQAWWKELGRFGSRPRTLAALAKSEPSARLLVVGSPDYVSAMEQDLIAARAELASPQSLVIVSSSPGARFADLKANWVPTDARLVARVGGSMVSLNAAVARDILTRTTPGGFVPSRLRRRYQKYADACPDAVVFDRAAVSDVQVRKWIVCRLRQNPSLSRTAALRELRGSGHRCEQTRFKGLFEEVRDA
jgi:hypothetical protein